MLSVTPAIPANQIVQIVPGVLSSGGTALQLNALFLTQNTRVPIGTILAFSSTNDAVSFFGAGSVEAAEAAIYFLGFDNSTAKPGQLLFWQYAESAVSAYLRGGNISALTLTQLQAINGTLNITIDGNVKGATINLSTATSFSNAAEIIANDLGIEGVQTAVVTGAIAGTTLTVSAVTSGALAVGDVISGSGVTVGTYITAFGTGSGGTGTYTVSVSQTASSTTITAFAPGVYYDSLSGAFVINSGTTGTTSTITFASGAAAAPLLLTQATGAVLSQGANASTPSGDMTKIVTTLTQNWASFMLLWNASVVENEEFAIWNNSQNNRYAFIMWTNNIVNTENSGPSADVAAINLAQYSGVNMNWDDTTIDPIGGEIAAMICGMIASIDFTRTNGRITFAFKGQTGITPQVTNGTIAQQLLAYGLNFYGDYTTANEAFNWYYNGSVSGPFLWLDSYVNQIWLNSQLQLALMVLLGQVNSLPYNQQGYNLIRAALLDPIDAAVNFGAIAQGVTLSNAQIAEVNNSAGTPIDTILSQRGWYLQILDATPQVRRVRGSPPMTFFYMDGGSVQSINLPSIEVQ